MDHPELRSRHPARRATALVGTLTAVVVTLVAFAPAAGADPVDVKYGGCVSTNPAVAAAPADYTTTVTLTPQGTGFQVGKAITITWHYSISTAPAGGIPIAHAASAKAKILIGGAATATVTTGSSALFPPAPVDAGKTFQIPDMTATFTPQAAGSYTLTPGDNEQDPIVPGLVITCKAGGAKPAATITVAAGSPGAGSTSSPAAGDTSNTSTSPATAGTTTSTISTLPHTGFDGRWLAGAVGLAAALGGGALAATRRRRGNHG